MSTEKIYTAVVREIKARPTLTGKKEIAHLDIGAGKGTLIKRLRENFSNIKSHGCDFHVDRFKTDGVEMKEINLDQAPLPYAEGSFDLITCTEVLEHVENYRAVVREIYRVLKPGGVVIFSTPNVLNVFSRWRNLICGFANLFGPIPVKSDIKYSTGGHITPVPYFYLAHALLDASFAKVELTKDKTNRTSFVLWLFLWPIIYLGWLGFWAKEKNRYKTLTKENIPLVKQHLSWPLLMGRTIIVSATKA